MADATDKQAESAEKAYAAAAAEAKADSLPAPAEVKAENPAPAKPASPAKAEAPKVEATPAPKAKAPAKPVTAKAKPAARPKATPKPKATAKKAPAKKAAPKEVPAKKPAAVKKVVKKPAAKPTVTQKDFMMAKTTDYTKMMSDAMSEAQAKAKEAYDKGTAMAAEMTEFSKGNVEALVEAGKILSTGMQTMGKEVVDEAKTAFETMTADLKEMAAVKSPTELFQLQSKLMRRNFDAMVAYGSKSSESMVKLSNEAIAPLSSRMNMAAEKISKAA